MIPQPTTGATAGAAHAHDPIVVMGVSGIGKSTIARLIGEQLGMPYLDADDLHGEANIAKMSAGIPLTDEDRLPWLHRVGEALATGAAPVMACSALKRAYREVLLTHAPRASFVMLSADAERITAQVTARTGHFMPPALLQSQLGALEPLQSDEPGLIVLVDDDPAPIASRIVSWVTSR